MRKFKTLAMSRVAVIFGGAVLTLGMAWSLMGTAKANDSVPPAQQKDKQPSGDQTLASQIAELHAKVSKLEAALKKGHKCTHSGTTPDKGSLARTPDKTGGDAPSDAVSAKFQNCLQCHQTRPSGPLPPSHLEEAGDSEKGTVKGRAGAGPLEPVLGKGKGTMGGKGMGGGEGMGDERKDMGGDGKAEMGGMSGGMEGTEMMEMMGVMGMAPKSGGGMAGIKSVGQMQLQAALPGFPGASHIYHVGATDFFLNHPEHITLTHKQQGDLARLKEKAVLAKTSAQRKIDEAEQQLWTLTSADEPDAAKIEANIQEIEKLRGEQRMALVRAVGGAAELLTDEQRQSLLGFESDETAKSDPHADHQSMQSGTPNKGGMAGMQDKIPTPAKQNDADESVDADEDLSAQVRELQARIANLEKALKTSP